MTYFQYASCKLFWLKEIVSHRGLGLRWRDALQLEKGTLTDTFRYRDDKLKKLLHHAVKTVPFYRKWFEKSGIDETKLTIEDFPIVSKVDIRNHEAEFVSDTIPVDVWSRTSGSTGEPFRFGKTKVENVYTYADLWRGMWRFGIRAGDKRVLVKGVDESPCQSVVTQIRRWIYGILNRCIVVDAHFLARTDANV